MDSKWSISGRIVGACAPLVYRRLAWCTAAALHFIFNSTATAYFKPVHTLHLHLQEKCDRTLNFALICGTKFDPSQRDPSVGSQDSLLLSLRCSDLRCLHVLLILQKKRIGYQRFPKSMPTRPREEMSDQEIAYQRRQRQIRYARRRADIIEYVLLIPYLTQPVENKQPNQGPALGESLRTR